MTVVALSPLFADTDPDTLEAALAMARRYCGWHIAPARTETLVIDGNGGIEIDLPTLHIIDVTKVTNDQQTLNLDADLEWSARGILRRRGGLWTRRFRGITVELTHGFAQLPADLAAVMAALADGGVAGKPTQMTAGPYTVNYGETATAGVTQLTLPHQRILDTYRLPPLP